MRTGREAPVPVADDHRPRPTLADVAARVGVSRTTASNAYNRPDQLSADMRERILTAAAELGYPGPDPVARSLRMQRAGAIGLILADRLSSAFADPAAVEFLQGVGLACEQHGASLMLVPAGREADNAPTVARAGVDGFVVFSMPDGDPHVEEVFARPQPAVVVDSPRGVAGVDFVGIDDRAGFRMVTEHVLSLGHRRIGVLSAPCGSGHPPGPASVAAAAASPSAVLAERMAGFTDAVTAAGLDPSGVPVWIAASHDRESGRIGTAGLLAARPDLTALVCGSDALALGALAELAERGTPVPDGISVTGFDDVPGAAAAGLTTVGQPTREKGRRAAELLLDPGPRDGPRTAVLPVSLVVRTSTGPAPD